MLTEYEKFYYEQKTRSFDISNLFDPFGREKGIRRFGFSILTKEAIDQLQKYAPFIEVGAGTGYWAYEMKKRDIDIIATDLKNMKNNKYKFQKEWTPIKCMTASQAIRKYPNRTLLMVWPCYSKSWGYKALKGYKGNTFVYCGEGHGGCTADDAFHELLEEEWKEHTDIPIPQWGGIHDYLTVFTREKIMRNTLRINSVHLLMV